MRKVLVTGGSGFIGSHLIRQLLLLGHDVRNVDIQAPFVGDHRPYWLELDLRDPSSVRELVASFKPDTIYNLAAIADILKGKDAFAVNTVGLENILHATTGLQARPRIIHASTQLVVGPGHEVSGPRDYFPYTEYGESKAESEEILWKWSPEVEWTIIRPTTVWGPLYPTFARSTWYYLYRRFYLVPSGRDAVRTYSYVGNLVSQLIAAGEADAQAVNRKMFYGGDASIPTSVWLDRFSRAFTDKPTRRVPYSMLVALARAGDLTAKLGGPSPINSGRLYRMTADFAVPLQPSLNTLGPLPYTLDEGVAATVEWLYSAYPSCFRPLRSAK